MVVPLSGQALSGLAVFAFGKLPAHGDFVARGLAAEPAYLAMFRDAEPVDGPPPPARAARNARA